ncbi:efflux RND transporter permease subunit [Haliscomenobacter hydrossis]|uniref:Acriflavin resistance protein n=1 Tax=Haliscomenobacter hydrossis (strain ATCC 27775 / DSM 1100 / LMG 10767 / O) TaxID=760192 RepID=F4L341_HALH1|nr:efflux RND transporter permease subunit [Haliscomenobacter hydrossis]AEE50700.1 acriflavin resistance protein [Haliscomenobacter hydrossis DSM 1100]
MTHSLSPVRILIFFTALALPALFILPYLQVNLLPAEPNTELQIRIQVPNTPPFGVERSTVSQLENALSAIRGLKNIRSESRYAEGSIYLEFGRKEDMAARRFEVATVLRSIYPKLPTGASYPTLSGGNDVAQEDKGPSLLYTVEGPGDVAAVRQRCETFFRQVLHQVEQVSNLEFQGGQEERMVIEFDPQLLKIHQVDPHELEQVLHRANGSYFPGSSEDAWGRKLFVRSIPADISLSTIENTLIKTEGGYPLRIKSVARVYQDRETPSSYYRINGKNAVSVFVFLSPDCNKVYEAVRIQQLITRAAAQQQDLHVRLAEDKTTFVRVELQKSWLRASASLLILLLLLLLTYRNWRLVLILLFCLMINLAITVLTSWAFQVEWHTYTLAGLSVAFGLMIDNAIVMLDAYRRRLNRRIFTALLAATLTTAAALLLVFFLPIEEQRNLVDFSIIIVISLISSLFTVLFLVPACYDLWIGAPALKSSNALKVAQKRRIFFRLAVYKSAIEFFSRWRLLFYVAGVLLFGLPVFLLPLETQSRQWHLQWLNSPNFQREVRPHLEFWLGGTLRLFVDTFNAESYYRQAEATALYVRAELPHGHTLAQMNTLMHHFERFLSQQNGLEVFGTSVNSGQYGDIEIHFTSDAEKTSLPLSLQARLQELAQGFSGVQWSIYGKGEGFSNNLFMDNQASSRLILRGYDYQELGRQAEKLGQLLAQNMRVQSIELDQNLNYFDRPLPEMYLSLDASKVAARHTNTGDLLNALNQMASPISFSLSSEKTSSEGLIKAQNTAQFDVYHLLHDPLSPSPKSNLHIQELGKMELRQSSSSIQRENRQYLRLVTFDYVGSYDLARQLNEQVIRKMNREMPLGYSVEGEQGSVSAATKRQFYLLLILLALNFFICAILFERLRQPFFILLTVPISFIGVFLSFAWGEFTFDQGGFAAFVMLGGIVVNAAIFIINDLNNAKGQVHNFQNTLIKVLYRRSGTILLTIVSTICGFVPFLYEGPETPFWFALAIGTIGGLMASILAVFLVLPVLLWKKKKLL